MPARPKIEAAIESLHKAKEALDLAELANLSDHAEGHLDRARLELEDTQYLVAEAIRNLNPRRKRPRPDAKKESALVASAEPAPPVIVASTPPAIPAPGPAAA